MNSLTSDVSLREVPEHGKRTVGLPAIARAVAIGMAIAMLVALLFASEIYPPFDEAAASAPDLSAIGLEGLLYSP